MNVDFPMLASIFYAIVIVAYSDSMATRKVMTVIVGSILVMNARRLRSAGEEEKAQRYFRAWYIVSIAGLSFNHMYDSIGMAGFVLGILGVPGNGAFVGLYHALAMTSAEKLLIPARTFLALSSVLM